MVLIQGIDVYFGIYKRTECWMNMNKNLHCEVGIALTNNSIPSEVKQVNSTQSGE